MAVKTQDELIGANPSDGGIFEIWAQGSDQPVTAQLKHRILNIDNTQKQLAVDEIADWIVVHHIPEYKLTEIAVKKRILDKYGFTDYLDNIEVLPVSDNTIVGNSTEVIMSEYLKSSSQLDMLVVKAQEGLASFYLDVESHDDVYSGVLSVLVELSQIAERAGIDLGLLLELIAENSNKINELGITEEETKEILENFGRGRSLPQFA